MSPRPHQHPGVTQAVHSTWAGGMSTSRGGRGASRPHGASLGLAVSASRAAAFPPGPRSRSPVCLSREHCPWRTSISREGPPSPQAGASAPSAGLGPAVSLALLSWGLADSGCLILCFVSTVTRRVLRLPCP